MTDVALITPYPPGGWTGVSAYAGDLARALDGRVSVIADVVDGAAVCERSGSLTVRRVWRRGALALPRAVLAALRTRAPVVHVQHELMLYGGPAAMPGVVAALALLRLSGRRAVVTLHHVVDPGEIDAEFTSTHRVRVPPRAARWAIVALQRAIRALAHEVVVHEPEFASRVPRAHVIPHGTTAAAVPPSREVARASLGLPGDRLVALCFGFLAPYKGLELAIAGAVEAGDGVQLVIAGGEHPRAGAAYADALRGKGAHARFTGFVPDGDVARWFAAADVALLLYPRPFATSGPLALALTHGTPVLLSPRLTAVTGAPPELAVALDRHALGARLRGLAENPAELAALRAATRTLAAGRTWPEVARRHREEVYA